MGTNIVPGRYKALIVLYSVNEYGDSDDYDAIYPAFTFSVHDSKNTIQIKWNMRNWGGIYFGKLDKEDNIR